MFACSFMISTFFFSDTSAENDFEIINATVLLGNNRGCFRIVIVDDSDPEEAENFTISFIVNKVQPEGVNIYSNQSEAVIIIQENDRKGHGCSFWGNCLFPCMSITRYTHVHQVPHAEHVESLKMAKHKAWLRRRRAVRLSLSRVSERIKSLGCRLASRLPSPLSCCLSSFC